MKTLLFKESPLLLVVITLLVGLTDKLMIKKQYTKHSLHLFVLYLVIVLALMYMYRVPSNTIHFPKNAMVSPCDGVIKSIEKINHDFTHVVIFLNLLDAHVQWYPLNGVIRSIAIKEGTFNPAHILHKAKHNERVETILFIPEINEDIKIVQIAGQIARRIVHYGHVRQRVRRGDLQGMIKFSSRVDLFIPHNKIHLYVRVGDKVYGNQTIIGYLTK
jgi:phosphatidylserine decarboxylase